MKRILCILAIIATLLSSCVHTQKKELLKLIYEWQGREILFPTDVTFERIDGKAVCLDSFNCTYKVFTYVDSIGCMSCKLKLSEWNDFMSMVDSLYPNTVSYQFIFQPYKIGELQLMLKREKFSAPICIDKKGKFEDLNEFPKNASFQTFLLDEKNKVLAVGNPINNVKIKELYLDVISGTSMTNKRGAIVKTKIDVEKTALYLGRFDWKEDRRGRFLIKNSGDKPWVIQDVTTSCGCTTVTYSKKPVLPGKEIDLEVVYKAEHPEHFNKTITVYCNAETSPLVLKISGDAK